MRQIFLTGFIVVICFGPSHKANAKISSNIAPVAAVGAGVALTGFLVDIIMSITVGSQSAGQNSLEERSMVDRATGLQVSALAIGLVTALSSGLTLLTAYQGKLESLVKTTRFALPVAMATTIAAAFLRGFAGQQLDAIAESGAGQRDKFHALAIVDYAFAAVSAANLTPLVATAGLTVREAFVRVWIFCSVR